VISMGEKSVCVYPKAIVTASVVGATSALERQLPNADWSFEPIVTSIASSRSSRGVCYIRRFHGHCMLSRNSFSLARRFLSTSSPAAMAKRVQVPFALEDGEQSAFPMFLFSRTQFADSIRGAAKNSSLMARNAKSCCRKSRDKSLLLRLNARSMVSHLYAGRIDIICLTRSLASLVFLIFSP
jgi:hypothetical protein